MSSTDVVGILLAAGFSRRYGANKLVQRLPDGTLVAVGSGRNLVAALPRSIAVVRPDVPERAPALQGAGLEVTVFAQSSLGMGASLAHAVRAAGEAAGYVVTLADMPFIQPATIARIADALRDGASIVAPRYAGERGHPVGFAGRYFAELSIVTGDEGAKHLIKRDGLAFLDVADPGVIRDIDSPADLPK